MIWKHAIRTPRMHMFDEDGTSCSQINFVMQACREALGIGQKLQIPYYKISDQWSHHISPAYYVNVDIDTIWLDKTMFLPIFIEFYDRPSSMKDDMWFNWDGSKCPPKMRLNRLAMDCYKWEAPAVSEEGIENVGATDVLRMFNSPRELYIVIARPRIVSNTSRVIFVEPSITPRQCSDLVELRSSLYPTENTSIVPDYTYTWDMAARRLEKILTQFKEKRAKDRKREVEENGHTPDEIDHWDDFMDISNLEIPKVRYVEAIELDRHWVRPKYERN